MNRFLVWAVFALSPFVPALAQPALTEPPEFPNRSPGPNAQPTAGGCFLLARGSLTPGDVDWVRVTVPWPSSQTIVDVDFPTGGTAGSALTASVVGGSSGFNIADNNVARDAVCGLHGGSSPVGSTRDSALSLGATARNAVINIGVTGAEDTGFTGAHSQTLSYDLWVSIVPTVCTSDANCSDNVACTVDRCDTVTGVCSNTPNHALCDNGRYCDGAETCSATLGCRPGTPPACNDGISCTVDVCDAALDACVHAPNDDVCDDGSFCNGAEWCDEMNDCQEADPVDCNDGLACTDDVCDEDLGQCRHTAVDVRCDNGLFCDGAERCDARLGCVAGTPPACADSVGCTIDACDESLDRCVHAPDDARCDDGLFCNGDEWCDAALGCRSGAPVNCDDSVDCTLDSCDEASRRCAHRTDDGRCDDGVYCNGTETCDATLGCLSGTTPDCDDQIPCTRDACNPATDRCESVADNALCDNGLYCDGQEWCDAAAGCHSGPPPCGDGPCREESESCAECAANADCDDGDFCNGAESCDASGACVDGTPPCAEGETCDSATGACRASGLTLDLMPRRCPNRISGEEKFLTAALVSVAGFDVRDVRPRSLRLSRVDGVGSAVSPVQDGRDRRPTVADVAAPYLGGAGGCSLTRADGWADLVVQFDAEETWKAFRLGRVRHGQTIELRLTGVLRSGASFELHDSVSTGRAAGPN